VARGGVGECGKEGGGGMIITRYVNMLLIFSMEHLSMNARSSQTQCWTSPAKQQRLFIFKLCGHFIFSVNILE
jgi:hypothetical protein